MHTLKNATVKVSAIIACIGVIASLYILKNTLSDNASENLEAITVDSDNYSVYGRDGSSSSLAEIISAAQLATVTFLGESHNDPVSHHLELKILNGISQPNLSLSLEMFESDIQYVLDEYLENLISQEHMLKSARAWKNYETDYQPLLEFAKKNNLKVIAANAPRRYVNMVSRSGQMILKSLTESAKDFLPPLPYIEASKKYKAKFESLMAKTIPSSESISEVDAIEGREEESNKALTYQLNMQQSLSAQSLWDASMAYSIAQALENNSISNILHINGSFHTAEELGIVEHLRRYRPETKTLVITMISSDDFPRFNFETMLGQGDYIIVTDASLPRSYD